MFALTADIPLGPFEGTQIKVYSAKGRTARLHARETCPSLRTDNVLTSTIPLDPTVIDRMCRQCASWGRWTRPDTALGIFLESLTGTGLLYQLNSYPSAEDGEDWTEEELEEAAALLGHGDYPSDDEPEERWAELEEARSLRDSALREWSSAVVSVHRAHGVISAYPWLEPWARQRLALKAEYVEKIRGQAARFIQAKSLLAAAVVFHSPEPKLVTSDPAFSALGDAATVLRLLQSLWRRWRAMVADSWEEPNPRSGVVYNFAEGLRRNYKKRREVLTRAEELVSAWADGAQVEASAHHERPDQLVLAVLSQEEDADQQRGGFQDALTRWELGVIIVYAVGADWSSRRVLLRVPQIIAARLLADSSALTCTPCPDSTDGELPALPVRQDDAAVLLPGVLDDTPVSDRRPITAAHVHSLRTARGFVDQPYIVFSAESGVEILPLSTIEKRCSTGWHGVLIAGASDLPRSVIKPWSENVSGTSDSNFERKWSNRNLAADHPNFGHHLGITAGEERLLFSVRHQYENERYREQVLRRLAIARNVQDLRILDDDLDRRHRSIPVEVWHALIASDQLDLEPFRPGKESEQLGDGLGLPLGILAEAQIYTTNADPAVSGKGHSPYCSHVRDPAITRYYDLITVADLLRRDEFDWCSKCGGYAVRRLTNDQLDYYRAAHRLFSIDRHLRGSYSRWGRQDAGFPSALSELDELKKWRPRDTELWRGGNEWRWREIVDDIKTKAQKIMLTVEQEFAGGKVIPIHQENKE